VWTVRLLKGADLVVGEMDVERGHGIREVMGFCGSEDGSGDYRVLQHPGKRDLRHRNAAGLGDLLYGVDDGLVAVDVKAAPNWIDVEALRVFAPRAR
jgi:hypothetical protein